MPFLITPTRRPESTCNGCTRDHTRIPGPRWEVSPTDESRRMVMTYCRQCLMDLHTALVECLLPLVDRE